MHLLPVTACFAPPASPTPPSALPRAAQIDGSGIAARDVTRFAVGADAAAGEVPQYGGDPCQARAAAANPSMADAMPYNVRTASTDRRHSRRARAVPRLSGRHQPGRHQPARADGVQREKLGRNAMQRENRAHRPPAPPTGRRRAATSGRHQPGRHQPARADGVQREKLGRNAIQRENRAHRPPAHRPAGAVPRLSGRHQPSGTSLPGPTASNARSSDAMPYNVRTARTGRRPTDRQAPCRDFWPAPTWPAPACPGRRRPTQEARTQCHAT